MISVRETYLYTEVLKELNYAFADVFIFNGFVVSEVKQGVIFGWEAHGKVITNDVSCFLGTDGKDLVYISNRINSYSVNPSGWLHFFKGSYLLKGYYIVSEHERSTLAAKVESLFFKNKIRRFNSIYEAINWLKHDNLEIA